MILKNKKKSLSELLITLFPFFIFTMHIFSYLWEVPDRITSDTFFIGFKDWFFINVIISIVFVVFTLFIHILRGYKYDWYVVWLSFTIFFSPFFLLNFKGKKFITWFCTDHLPFFMIDKHFYYTTRKVNYLVFFIIFALFLFMIIFLVKSLRMSGFRLFLFLISYFFSHCSLIIPSLYHRYYQVLITPDMVYVPFYYIPFYIANSILTILLLILFYKYKGTLKRVIFTFLYFLFNFFIIFAPILKKLLLRDYENYYRDIFISFFPGDYLIYFLYYSTIHITPILFFITIFKLIQKRLKKIKKNNGENMEKMDVATK